LSGNYTTRLIGEDFNYQENIPKDSELRMALIAAAVSAYSKEYKGAKENDENSRWKSLAREEGMR
jgi:hypothetical protein